MALIGTFIRVETLNGNRLSLQSRPELIVDETLVDLAEPALAEEITRREAVSDDLELLNSENVEIRTGEGDREVGGESRGAQIRKRNPLKLKRRSLLLLRILFLHLLRRNIVDLKTTRKKRLQSNLHRRRLMCIDFSMIESL